MPKKKTRKLLNIPVGPPPILSDDEAPPMISEDEDEDKDGLQDIFKFSEFVQDINHVLESKEPFLLVNYWKEICRECNVTGDVIQDKKVTYILYILLHAFIFYFYFIILNFFFFNDGNFFS